MPREYKLYLNDIRTAIERIERYVAASDLETFRKDDVVVDATLHNFTIIGEAAKNVPDEIRTKYEDVPWRAIASFRNLLAHEYFRVDLEETWRIIRENLPVLKAQIIHILEQENDGDGA